MIRRTPRRRAGLEVIDIRVANAWKVESR